MKWMIAISLSLCLACGGLYGQVPVYVDPGSTDESNGRHLCREGSTVRLRLVYTQNGQIRYGYSSNEGISWSLQSVPQPSPVARHPSIGLAWGQNPFPACVSYACDGTGTYYCSYRWYNGSIWQGFDIPYEGPVYRTSLTTYQDTVFFTYEVWPMDLGGWGEIHWAYCAYNGTGLSIGRLPGVLSSQSPSIAADGNGNAYIAHCNASNRITVWRKLSGPNSWEPANGPDPYDPTTFQVQTFAECWGDSIFVGWCEMHPNPPYQQDVFRKSAWLPDWPTFTWQNPMGSPTTDLGSESPTIAEGEFLVWAEENNMGIVPQFDLYYKSRRFGEGWLTNSDYNSNYPTALMRQKLDVRLYYPWSEVQPYEVWFNKTIWPLPAKSDPGRAYYVVEAGKELQSYYCTKRDGFKVYGQHSIDFGKDFVSYRLEYLDPRYDFTLKGSAYFEGTSSVTADIFIDGVKYGSIQIAPGVLKTFQAVIPRHLYQNDAQVSVVLRNTGGDFVPVAELVLYADEPEVKAMSEGGSTQGSEGSYAGTQAFVSVSPNPAKTAVTIAFAGDLGKVRRVQVFDASGRFVKAVTQVTGRLHWDCRDEAGRTVAPGVYLIRVETDDQMYTKKVVVTK